MTHQESGDADKERETLERYCNRQVKSRKFIKRKNEDLDEKIAWKRQKDQEKGNVRKMRIKEQFTTQMKQKQKEVQEYQERWHQTGAFYHDYDMLSEGDIEKRVKRSLRVQDQNDNLKRILNQQKQYKMILVQEMLHKDRKIRDFTEFRKSLAIPQAVSSTMRN